ncbi:hypothetical protein GALMADRAFT_148757 [Galerina marginata CBS 339.88]|uniref:Chromatin elongation factor SPT5 n=1 Tax=Galerina marginata (strain CBS 339.88) TaxID=685588 RepID=A0A067S3I4_GALM3|nr:hypothetical protein GALMADRAFT_148757 [Galerina marginata CBS 339.88]
MSTPEYPRKKQRIETNPFVDIEAEVDTEEDDDDNDEVGSNLGGFIADEDESCSYSAFLPNAPISEHNPPNIPDWLDRLVAKQMAKEQRQREVREQDAELLPRADDRLWEVLCAHGWEEFAVYDLMIRAKDLYSCSSLSAFATIPGRIFVEAPTAADVLLLIKGVKNLKTRDLRLVPNDLMVEYLSWGRPAIEAQTWARIRKRSAFGIQHDGDLCLVTKLERAGSLEVRLVPRLICSTGPDKRLFLPALADKSLGRVSQSISDDGVRIWRWQSLEFGSDGFRIAKGISVHDLEGDATPTAKELDLFQKCSALLPATLTLAKHLVEIAVMVVGDRVRVIRGDELGQIGTLLSLGENEASLSVEGRTEPLETNTENIARHFKVGDQVDISIGEHRGKVGWVIAVSDGALDITIVPDITTSIPTSFVTFHRQQFRHAMKDATAISAEDREKYSYAPKDATASSPEDRKAMSSNEYAWLKGKTVQIVGAHEYKGVWGIVKDISLEGVAEIELSRIPITVTSVEKGHYMFLREAPLTSLGPLQHAAGVSPAARPSSTVVESTPLPSAEDLEGRTGHWDATLEPAVEDDVQDEVQKDMSWVNQSSKQLVVRVRGEASAREFLSSEGDKAFVRFGMLNAEVLLKDLSITPPTTVGEEVIVWRGPEYLGERFKVQNIDAANALCTLRPMALVGKKATRTQQLAFPSLPIENLATVFALKRRF